MASLIVAGSILVHNKIKDKKEARLEKKRQTYEDRYKELQREHSEHEEKYLSRRKTNESVASSSHGDVVANTIRPRTSRGSLRSNDDDGPTQWVDEALKEKRRG